MLLCYFFIIAPRLKIPLFAKNQPKIPKNPLKKHFFTFIPFYFAFRPPPTVPPPPQVCQSGLTIRGHSKKWTYDGKNVASVAYVVDNSQICIERYNRTLGTLTSVDAGGQSGVEPTWRGRDGTRLHCRVRHSRRYVGR